MSAFPKKPASQDSVVEALSDVAVSLGRKIEASEERVVARIDASEARINDRIDARIAESETRVMAEVSTVKADVRRIETVMNENHLELNAKMNSILALLGSK